MSKCRNIRNDPYEKTHDAYNTIELRMRHAW